MRDCKLSSNTKESPGCILPDSFRKEGKCYFWLWRRAFPFIMKLKQRERPEAFGGRREVDIVSLRLLGFSKNKKWQEHVRTQISPLCESIPGSLRSSAGFT